MSKISDIEGAMDKHGADNVSLDTDGTLQLKRPEIPRPTLAELEEILDPPVSKDTLLHMLHLKVNKLVLAATAQLGDAEIDRVEREVIELATALLNEEPKKFPFKCVGFCGPCPEPLTWTSAYRCLDCDMWFCATCLRLHFDESKQAAKLRAPRPDRGITALALRYFYLGPINALISFLGRDDEIEELRTRAEQEWKRDAALVQSPSDNS